MGFSSGTECLSVLEGGAVKIAVALCFAGGHHFEISSQNRGALHLPWPLEGTGADGVDVGMIPEVRYVSSCLVLDGSVYLL